jgi:hypothetical protein
MTCEDAVIVSHCLSGLRRNRMKIPRMFRAPSCSERGHDTRCTPRRVSTERRRYAEDVQATYHLHFTDGRGRLHLA